MNVSLLKNKCMNQYACYFFVVCLSTPTLKTCGNSCSTNSKVQIKSFLFEIIKFLFI